MSPDIHLYTVADLLAHGLQQMIPSIQLQTFTTADIEAKRNIIPSTLKAVAGTAKFHEVCAINGNGVCQLYAANLSGDDRKRINI